MNDAYGHAAGDAVLVAIAKRLQTEIRQTDTVARLGGDEFVILLDNPSSIAEIERVADRVLHAVRQPIEVHGQSVEVGISIGVATNACLGETPEDLIERADLAMYAAKCAGKNRFYFSDSADAAA